MGLEQGAPPPQGYYPGYNAPPPGPAGQPHNPGQYQAGQQPYGQPQQGQYPQGQYPPPGQPQQGQYAPPGPPPQGQYNQPPQGQYAPPGAPQQNYQAFQGNQQYPPQQYNNQPPPQGYPGQQQPQQPYPNQPPAQNYQGPPQGYPGQLPQQYQGGPPQGYAGQPSPQPYGQQPIGLPPGQNPPGQYYNPNQPQAYQGGGAPPPHHVWQPPPGSYSEQPVPASLGYDENQKHSFQHVLHELKTSADEDALRKAMKGMGCDERALIKTLTSPKYESPWAMKKLVEEYNRRFIRDLVKDVKSETRGSFEDALVTLIQGPLETDARTLDRAMDRAGTDETALADVLLCRSNADIRAITQKYKEITGKNLAKEIKSEVSETLQRLYSMVLAAERREPSPYAQVNPQEVEKHVVELHQATEGVIGSNAISVAQILASSSDKHIAAINTEYQRKYHRSLEDVIEKEFRGDTEDALLHMLMVGTNRARADAEWLRQPLTRGVGVKDKHFIYRITTLYWNKPRLEEAKKAYEQHFRRKLVTDVKEMLSGDYEDLIVALVGGKK